MEQKVREYIDDLRQRNLTASEVDSVVSRFSTDLLDLYNSNKYEEMCELWRACTRLPVKILVKISARVENELVDAATKCGPDSE